VDAPRDPNDTPARRTSVRRTVLVLALVAGAVYAYFIVKTFVNHAGGAA
jgi:preprotein translocase subunit SecE